MEKQNCVEGDDEDEDAVHTQEKEVSELQLKTEFVSLVADNILKRVDVPGVQQSPALQSTGRASRSNSEAAPAEQQAKPKAKAKAKGRVSTRRKTAASDPALMVRN